MLAAEKLMSVADDVYMCKLSERLSFDRGLESGVQLSKKDVLESPAVSQRLPFDASLQIFCIVFSE